MHIAAPTCYAPLQHLLALKPADESTAYGTYREYPIAITVLGGKVATGLLVQLRHLGTEEQVELFDSADWAQTLADPSATERAEISVEAGIAWLTILDPATVDDYDRLIELIDLLIDGLQGAGIVSPAGACHYCRNNLAPDVIYAEGRVAQICPRCLAAKQSESRPSGQNKGAISLVAAIIAGTLAAAAIWCAIWWLHDVIIEWLFGNRSNRVILLPHIAELAILAATVLPIAWPVAYAFRKLSPSPPPLGKAGVYLSVTLGAALGEFLHLNSVLPHRLPLSMLCRIYWLASPGVLLVYKGACVLVAALLAFDLAYPRRAKLHL